MESDISRVKIVTKTGSGSGKGGGGGMPSNVKPFGSPSNAEKGEGEGGSSQGGGGTVLVPAEGGGGQGQGGHRIIVGGNTMDKHLTSGSGSHKPKEINPNGAEQHEANNWDHLSEDQKEAMINDTLRDVIDKTERQWGEGGGGIPRGFNRKSLQPREDWKRILEEFLDDERVRVINDMKPNMREIAGTGSWASGADYEQIAIKCMIAIDVSGSIDQEDLTLFITKVHEIIDEPDFPEVKIELLFWDGIVEKHVTLDTSEQGGKMNVAQILEGVTTSGRVPGGGGTDPSCINTWVIANKQKLDIDVEDLHILIMTDGFFSSDFTLPHTYVQPIWILNGKKATDEHIKNNPRIKYSDIHFVDLKRK